MAPLFRPKINLASLLSEQNPHIDLHLEEYERRTQWFATRMSGFHDNVQKDILNGQEVFTAEMKRHMERMAKYEEQTNQHKAKELELAAGT
jgi:kinetochore protein Spc25